jgi:hypothetical protein
MNLIEIGTTPYAAAALRAGDADTVGGLTASHLRDASRVTSGTLSNERFSAYSDLVSEGYLAGSEAAHLVTHAQAEARYVAQGQANSITGPMIATGQVDVSHLDVGSVDPRYVNAGQSNSVTLTMLNATDRDCTADAELCSRSQMDSRYVNAGASNSVTLSMINATERDCSTSADLCSRLQMDERFVNVGEGIDASTITSGLINTNRLRLERGAVNHGGGGGVVNVTFAAPLLLTPRVFTQPRTRASLATADQYCVTQSVSETGFFLYCYGNASVVDWMAIY